MLMIHSRSDFDIMYDDRIIALRYSQSVCSEKYRLGGAQMVLGFCA